MSEEQGVVEPRIVEDLGEFIELTQLVDVHFERISAERTPVLNAEVDRDSDAPNESDPEPELAVFQRVIDPETFEIRPVLTLETGAARLLVDLSLIYKHSEPIQVDAAVRQEFLTRVGIMSAWPYLREGVQTQAAKIQVPPPVIGLLRAGQFDLEKDDEAGQPWDIETVKSEN